MSETLTVQPAAAASTEELDEDELQHVANPVASADIPEDSAPDDVGDDHPDDQAVPAADTPKKGLKNAMTSTAFATGVAEMAGIGVDALLMGGGQAGVELLKSIPVREGLAIGPDVAIIQRIQKWAREKAGHEVSKEDAEKKLRKIGGLAVTAVVAVAAQKAGLGVIEHVNEHSGVLHFVAPLTTKVGAVTAARRVLRL